MDWSRRAFLAGSAALASAAGFGGRNFVAPDAAFESHEVVQPTYAVVPVVGDGKWIWTEPPKDDTGYLEPRTFDLSVEIHLRGKSAASNITAFTAAPVQFPEQEVVDFEVQTSGCRAEVQPLTSSAARLFMAANSIRAGQVITASAKYRLKIAKSYFGYEREMFPEKQELPRAAKLFLGNGPGIQTSAREVRELARKVAGDLTHPWDIAKALHTWVWENIEGRPQLYTNVVTAIRKRVGDCEERAAVFVALCRSRGIPARLVWVPNHNWAEFLLADEEGELHWIPSHTSAYNWFGWTGAHELVLQKGDRVPLPGKKAVRLIHDNIRCVGQRPEFFFTANLTPVSEDDQDAGPGARKKAKTGQWKLVGTHADQKYMRV